MDKERVQRYAETIEKLIQRDIDSYSTVLKADEFHALNFLMLELIRGEYYTQK
jgi:hypothetical protein